MKKCLTLVIFAFSLFCSYIHRAEAVIFTDLITFSPSVTVTDTQSGNSIDYTYQHHLSGLDLPNTVINSATLQLQHAGNPDIGPTQEVWFALSGGGNLIGRLSKSDPTDYLDEWVLSKPILDEITLKHPWTLTIALSEQTSYNSEKISLLSSNLQIDYTRNDPNQNRAPLTPEPSTIILVAIGLIGLARKCRNL